MMAALTWNRCREEHSVGVARDGSQIRLDVLARDVFSYLERHCEVVGSPQVDWVAKIELPDGVPRHLEIGITRIAAFNACDVADA